MNWRVMSVVGFHSKQFVILASKNLRVILWERKINSSYAANSLNFTDVSTVALSVDELKILREFRMGVSGPSSADAWAVNS